MIIHPAEQGSLAWIEARLGRATASAFAKIITPGGKLSKSREGYMATLLAEHFLGEPVDEFHGTEWTERGTVLEPDAFACYAFRNDEEPIKCGFIYRDETELVGCSPDGLVGDDGLLELKCPMAGTHLMYLAQGAVPSAYVPQVQGQLWVTGRAWCDFMSYHPGFPPLVVRMAPDPRLQAAFDAHIPQFCDEMLEARERLLAMGVQRDTEPLMERRVEPTGQQRKRDDPAVPPGTTEAAIAAYKREGMS